MISAVCMFVLSKENRTYKQAEAQIIELSQNIAKAYQAKPNYWGLSTAEVINKKLYAQGMRSKGEKLIGYFNQEVEIGADENGNIVMPASKNFVIAYKDLSKKQCIGLSSQKFNKTFWLRINKFSIKNEQFSQDFTWGSSEYGLPLQKQSLRNACVSDKNTIVFTF